MMKGDGTTKSAYSTKSKHTHTEAEGASKPQERMMLETNFSDSVRKVEAMRTSSNMNPPSTAPVQQRNRASTQSRVINSAGVENTVGGLSNQSSILNRIASTGRNSSRLRREGGGTTEAASEHSKPAYIGDYQIPQKLNDVRSNIKERLENLRRLFEEEDANARQEELERNGLQGSSNPADWDLEGHKIMY